MDRLDWDSATLVHVGKGWIKRGFNSCNRLGLGLYDVSVECSN